MADKTLRRPYATRLPRDERREQLLDAALRLLATQGFDAITMASISREAGVTRPVVYAQFASLAELLEALLARQGQRAVRQIAAAMTVNPGESDPEDIVVRGLKAFLGAVESDSDGWRVILFPPESMPGVLRRRIAQTRRQITNALEGTVSWGLEQRGISAGADIELFMMTLIELFEQAGRLVIKNGEQFPPDRIVRFAQGLLASVPSAH